MLLIFDSITSSSLCAAISMDTFAVIVELDKSFAFTLLEIIIVTKGYRT